MERHLGVMCNESPAIHFSSDKNIERVLIVNQLCLEAEIDPQVETSCSIFAKQSAEQCCTTVGSLLKTAQRELHGLSACDSKVSHCARAPPPSKFLSGFGD